MNALNRFLVLLGGAALLVALGVDTFAMAGRHLRLPLIGSIEIVQVAVLVAGACALLIATLAGVHARVHLLVERVPPRLRMAMHRWNALCACLLIVALIIGSFWLLADLWRGQEESELLKLPYRPLRVITLLALVGMLWAFCRQLWRPGAR
jgi:TRAP-type transport system small permease protein